MTTPGPRYSKEEYARRGDSIYERDIKPKLKPEDHGKYIAIDIDPNGETVGDGLLERKPDAQIWVVRVGHRAAMTIRARFPLREDR